MTQATATRIRKDPKQRHVSGQAQTFDGTPAWTKLQNKREDRVYKLVYKAGGETNQLNRYLEMGYEVELWGDPKDSNRLRFGTGKGPQSQGDAMEYNGHVVLSIDKAENDRMEAEGDGQGGMGQNYVDRVERQIRRGTGIDNPLRGRRGIYRDRLYLERPENNDGAYNDGQYDSIGSGGRDDFEE